MLAPLLVLCCWAFWRLPPRAITPRQRVLNVTVILSALFLSAIASLWIAGVNFGGNNAVWRPVFSTLATFFVFPAVLAVGWWLRRRIQMSVRR